MTTALIGFAALLALCFFGFRVGFATLFVGFVGFALERGTTASLAMVAQQVTEDAQNYNLSVIPLFILMGVFIYRSDISQDLYDAAYGALGRFRGGLALATVLACGGFSAVCGSTLATAATMSKVAMPQMKAYNYSDKLAAGTIAAGGTLGIMIPPSVPMVTMLSNAGISGGGITGIFLHWAFVWMTASNLLGLCQRRSGRDVLIEGHFGFRKAKASGREYVSLTLADPQIGPRRIYANLAPVKGKKGRHVILWNPRD